MVFPFDKVKRVVIKLGTGILTEGIGQLHTKRIEGICEQVHQLRQAGKEVIIISSGAVGLGMGRLGLTKKPKKLASLQKCAAIGQSRLIEIWQKSFEPYNTLVGQLLLTRDDVASRDRHVAAKNLVNELLSEGIVPIINENDSISAAEIKFGDNDILSAMVASMSKADLLIILSTAPGLIDMNKGELLPVVEKITPEIEALAQGTTSITATGGMVTKIQAASMATQSGCAFFIGSGEKPEIVSDIFREKATGTLFLPSKSEMESRKRWIAFFHKPAGSVFIDAGAENALRTKGSSLLAKGVTKSTGKFSAGDVISIIGTGEKAFANGIAEYDSHELQTLFGLETEKIKAQFPDRKHHEVIHRDSLVMIDG